PTSSSMPRFRSPSRRRIGRASSSYGECGRDHASYCCSLAVNLLLGSFSTGWSSILCVSTVSIVCTIRAPVPVRPEDDLAPLHIHVADATDGLTVYGIRSRPAVILIVRILNIRLRHEQHIRQALLEVADHRRLGPGGSRSPTGPVASGGR